MECRIKDCTLVGSCEFKTQPRAIAGYAGETFAFCGIHSEEGKKLVRNVNRKMRRRAISMEQGGDWDGRDCEGCGENIPDEKITRADQKFCTEACRIRTYNTWRLEARKQEAA